MPFFRSEHRLRHELLKDNLVATALAEGLVRGMLALSVPQRHRHREREGQEPMLVLGEPHVGVLLLEVLGDPRAATTCSRLLELCDNVFLVDRRHAVILRLLLFRESMNT